MFLGDRRANKADLGRLRYRNRFHALSLDLLLSTAPSPSHSCGLDRCARSRAVVAHRQRISQRARSFEKQQPYRHKQQAFSLKEPLPPSPPDYLYSITRLRPSPILATFHLSEAWRHSPHVDHPYSFFTPTKRCQRGPNCCFSDQQQQQQHSGLRSTTGATTAGRGLLVRGHVCTFRTGSTATHSTASPYGFGCRDLFGPQSLFH